jgi:c-di-GMP-binding flagellar brake protein YcgR
MASAPYLSQTGILTRSPREITRVLETVRSRGTLVAAIFGGGGATFQSLIRQVDAAGGRLVLERSPSEASNAALLARQRCTFQSEVTGWRIEFVATQPREVVHEGVRAIELRFPEVLVSHQRRQQSRIDEPQLALLCLADAAGITPFDATILDLSLAGIGFLLYAADITLEPGTVLKGCRIALSERDACSVDLEVRYSQQVTAADGRRAMRSGCRFLDPTEEVLALLRTYLGGAA